MSAGFFSRGKAQEGRGRRRNRQGALFLADGSGLFRQRVRNLSGSVQRNQAVLDVVQRKSERLHGEDLMQLDPILVGIQPAAADGEHRLSRS